MYLFHCIGGGDLNQLLNNVDVKLANEMIKLNSANSTLLDKFFNIISNSGLNIHYIIISILTLICENVRIAISIYFALSFPVLTITVYFVLRKMNISILSSYMISLIVPFFPYRIMRGGIQIPVGFFIMAPLTMYCVWLIGQGNNKEYSPNGLQTIFFFTVCSFPFFSIEYSYMSLILLIFAIIFSGRKFTYKFKVKLIFILIIGMLLTLLIDLKFSNEKIFDSSNIYLNIVNAKAGSLKFVQLILPIINHRIKPFADMRNYYDDSFAAYGENGLCSLGIFFAFSLLLSLFMLFFIKKNFSDFLKKIYFGGIINLFIIFLASEGGFGVWLTLIGVNIKQYNHMYAFLLINICIITGFIFDKIFSNKFYI